ncbi:MAG: peroxiredoxin family protein, partial [Solirubrobacteraceae bacterium]
SRYAWVLGIAAILAAGLLVIGSTRPDGPGAVGLPAGSQLPPFAAVRASSDIVCDSDDDPCDVNVAASGAHVGSEAGSRPACEVRGPTVLNVCELVERGPLVLGLVATRDAGCVRSFDAFTALTRRHRGLQVAVVGIRGGLEELRRVARERRWTFAVGWDRDGALASLYGVATCPYIVVARWHGGVQATLLGSAAPAELEHQSARAVQASRRAGWRP